MELSAHAKLLASIPMFSSIPKEDLEELSATLTVRDVEQGGDVFRQGDKGAKLYVIQEGEITISVGEGQRRVVLTSLHKGQYFGEMSIIDGAPRSATAAAAKAASLLELDRKHFVEFLKRKPLSSIYIMAELGDRMRATNELMTRQLTKNVAGEAEGKAGGLRGIADSLGALFGTAPVTFAAMLILFVVSVTPVFIMLNPQVYAEASVPNEGPNAGALVYAIVVVVGAFWAAVMGPLILYTLQRLSERLKALGESGYRVNLKNEVSIEAILRKQGETLARVSLVERRLGLDFDAPVK